MKLIQTIADSNYDDSDELFDSNMLYFTSKYFFEKYVKRSLLIELAISLISIVFFGFHIIYF